MAIIYLKDGDIIGNDGYTDLIITENGTGYRLYNTEGGNLDYYDEASDTHYNVTFDMVGTRETNPNFGRMYYEIEED